MKKNHVLWMIVGCGFPLLFIFIAPALELGSGVSLFIVIIAMFACHLLMPMHHHGGHNHEQNQQNSQASKTENHEHLH